MPKIREIYHSMDKFRKANRDGRNTPEHQQNIALPVLKDILKKHLYPTRDERLEQDIKVRNIIHDDVRNGWDFYIESWGEACKLTDDPYKTRAAYGIKILNERIREKLNDIMPKLQEIYANVDIGIYQSTGGSISIQMPRLQEVLKKHLYPTRDERLEQDIFLKREDDSFSTTGYDYYIRMDDTPYVWGTAPPHKRTISIRILNEDMREKVVDILNGLKDDKEYMEKYDYTTLRKITGDDSIRGGVDIRKFKIYLKKHLYPKDDTTIYTPSWEEEYELKKAIKIEREIHSKQLF
jgi:hypothetical protein